MRSLLLLIPCCGVISVLWVILGVHVTATKLLPNGKTVRAFSANEFKATYGLMVQYKHGSSVPTCPEVIQYNGTPSASGAELSLAHQDMAIAASSESALEQCTDDGELVLVRWDELAGEALNTFESGIAEDIDKEVLYNDVKLRLAGKKYYVSVNDSARTCGDTWFGGNETFLFFDESGEIDVQVVAKIRNDEPVLLSLPLIGNIRYMISVRLGSTCIYRVETDVDDLLNNISRPSDTPTISPTPTRTPTISPSVSDSASASPSGIPVASSTPDVTSSASASSTASTSASPSASSTASTSASPSPSSTASITTSPSASESVSGSPSVTSQPSESPLASVSASSTGTVSSTPSSSGSSGSVSASPSVSSQTSASPAASVSDTPTVSPHPSVSVSTSPSQSLETSPSITEATSPSAVPELSTIPTSSSTPPVDDTQTPLPSEAATPTFESTETPTSTPSQSASPTRTVDPNNPNNQVGGGDRNDTVFIDGMSTCFPSEATVIVDSGRVIPISQLAVGDRVLAADASFSEVLLFTHADTAVSSSFFNLLTEGGKSLKLSPGHYIESSGILKQAKDVQVGDAVWVVGQEGKDWRRSEERVVQKKKVVEVGLFNPQTSTGTIVVDGIAASCYTQVVPPAAAHALMAPIRSLARRHSRWLSRLIAGKVSEAAAMITG